jgi:hypothetical protein
MRVLASGEPRSGTPPVSSALHVVKAVVELIHHRLDWFHRTVVNNDAVKVGQRLRSNRAKCPSQRVWTVIRGDDY